MHPMHEFTPEVVLDGVTYHVVVDEHSSRQRPAGVARRFPSGRVEVFGRNSQWNSTEKYADEEQLPQKIDADEAERIVHRLRQSAAGLALPAAAPGGKPEPDDLGVDPDRLDWQRSGDGSGGIEIAVPNIDGWIHGDWVLMRVNGDDSDLVLVFDRNEWTCFLDGARKGEFDDAVL